MLPMALREGAASADPQWARLQVDVNCRVRRGAWYRVADVRPAEVRLDVNREQIPVPRASLKIVTAPPQHWTIVARPRDARDRKSTRLNSSHRCISYAVFCLKKKNRL